MQSSNRGATAAAAAADAQGSAAQPRGQFLTFAHGGETFAIGILKLKEIIEYQTPTVLPMQPASIRGVINLRGAVVPVMDLSARFGAEPRGTTRRSCIVIVEIERQDLRQDIGVIVDAVNEVLEIAASDIEPAPTFGARIRTDFIQGVGKVAGKLVIVLDVERVLSVGELGELAGEGAHAVSGVARDEAVAPLQDAA